MNRSAARDGDAAGRLELTLEGDQQRSARSGRGLPLNGESRQGPRWLVLTVPTKLVVNGARPAAWPPAGGDVEPAPDPDDRTEVGVPARWA